MVTGMSRFDEIRSELDSGICEIVRILMEAGVETFESCEGGPGHAFTHPTVRFHGHREEGFRAMAVAQSHGLNVTYLRRVWDVIEGEPTGPQWEMVFYLDSATRSEAA
jgi:hypothetical protein